MFTKTEWDILKHRLEVSDSIADVLLDTYGYSWNETVKRVDYIKNNPSCIDLNDEFDKTILKECCEGCTFFADIEESVIEGSLTKGQILIYYKAAYSLEKKIGVEVTII